MENEKKYITPEMEITKFETKDIITVSDLLSNLNLMKAEFTNKNWQAASRCPASLTYGGKEVYYNNICDDKLCLY